MWKKGGWMSEIMNEIEELEVIEGKDRCILGCFSRKGQDVASPPQTVGVCFLGISVIIEKKNATLEGPTLKRNVLNHWVTDFVRLN